MLEEFEAGGGEDNEEEAGGGGGLMVSTGLGPLYQSL